MNLLLWLSLSFASDRFDPIDIEPNTHETAAFQSNINTHGIHKQSKANKGEKKNRYNKGEHIEVKREVAARIMWQDKTTSTIHAQDRAGSMDDQQEG